MTKMIPASAVCPKMPEISGGDQKNDDEGIEKQGKEFPGNRSARYRRGIVGAILREALLCFLAGQAGEVAG